MEKDFGYIVFPEPRPRRPTPSFDEVLAKVVADRHERERRLYEKSSYLVWIPIALLVVLAVMIVLAIVL